MRDDIARCAQKLHTPPRMVSLLTDSLQRNHPTVAICFTVRTPRKTRGYRLWLRVLWSRTGVCYACVDVELTFLYSRSYIFQCCNFQYRIFRSRIFHPCILVLHFLVLHFSPLHFWSCIFQYCILVPQT